MVWSNQSAAFSSGKVRPNHETNINIIARRTGKDVNSHTVLDGIITTIMATIQRINIIGSREGSRNRRRLKANQTGRSEERFSRNAETEIVCRLLLEKKNSSIDWKSYARYQTLKTKQLELEERNALLIVMDARKPQFESFLSAATRINIYTLSLHDALPILTV